MNTELDLQVLLDLDDLERTANLVAAGQAQWVARYGLNELAPPYFPTSVVLTLIARIRKLESALRDVLDNPIDVHLGQVRKLLEGS